MSEWFSPAELAAKSLPNLPTSERAIQIMANRENWQKRNDLSGAALARKRQSRGGGGEYHYSLLPSTAQTKIALDLAPAKIPTSKNEALSKAEAWVFFETLNDKRKETARRRLEIIVVVRALEKGGSPKNLAVITAAEKYKTSTSTIYNWLNLVAGVERDDWLPALAPRHVGRTKTVECSTGAWEYIKADYLRPERPTFKSCYRRLKRAAEDQGWSVPSARTLERKMEIEISAPVQVLARHGADALKTMFPAQERDRSVFHALEAVNADGHLWDVWVKWPDGTVARPMMIAIQDLYSGLFLGWRIDTSENKEAVRLAIGDVVEDYGIPKRIYLDNGRSFASKWLTGGIANRFRFKIKDEEPVGILTQLGVEVRWTLPYSGQSKPIERAFRDFCDNIAKDPAFAGAWTGNTPLNKPENYGSKAVPLETFIQVVGEGIKEHNQRTGRRGGVCNGRSFLEVFKESYEKAAITKATEEQRRLWLLAAEGVKAARRDGTINLLNNRYWSDFMLGHLGQALVVRFDPDAMHSGLHVYRLDGSYIGYAECVEAVGFNDVAAARVHGRKRRQFMKTTKELQNLHVSLTGEELARMIPVPDNTPPMENKVVKLATTVGGDPIMKRPDKVEAPALSDEDQASADALFKELNGDVPEAEVCAFPIPEGMRPAFQSDEELVRWVLNNPDIADDEDKELAEKKLKNPSFCLLMGIDPKKENRHA